MRTAKGQLNAAQTGKAMNGNRDTAMHEEATPGWWPTLLPSAGQLKAAVVQVTPFMLGTRPAALLTTYQCGKAGRSGCCGESLHRARRSAG